MKIEILGTGCNKCRKLHQLVEESIAATGVDAEVLKVENLEDITQYGVALTPALVIDGTVRAAGGLPKLAQIEAWLEAAKPEGCVPKNVLIAENRS